MPLHPTICINKRVSFKIKWPKFLRKSCWRVSISPSSTPEYLVNHFGTYKSHGEFRRAFLLYLLIGRMLRRQTLSTEFSNPNFHSTLQGQTLSLQAILSLSCLSKIQCWKLKKVSCDWKQLISDLQTGVSSPHGDRQWKQTAVCLCCVTLAFTKPNEPMLRAQGRMMTKKASTDL